MNARGGGRACHNSVMCLLARGPEPWNVPPVATTWFITRERADAEADCESLRHRGLEAVPLPCVTTRLLPWPWPDAEGDTMTVFTSRRAVDSWLKTNTRLTRVASTAPATSHWLRRSGIQIELETDGGAVPLAQAILSAKRPARLRYPTSNLGLESHEQNAAVKLLEGFPLDRQLAYEVKPPGELVEAARALHRGDYALAFASPSAVRYFLELAATSPTPRHVVCFGASTARAWDRSRPQSWPGAKFTRDLHSTILEVSAT